MTIDKPTPCYFIQGSFGNIIMRLSSITNGPGVTLTLHQIVALNIHIKAIPSIDIHGFKGFYNTENVFMQKVYDRLTRHNIEEKLFVEQLK